MIQDNRNGEEEYLASIQKALEEEQLTPTAAENSEKWLTDEELSEFRDEIRSMIKNGEFDKLNDSFYTVIPFGTSGRRGPVGVGPNRINFRTIGESAQAVADYFFQDKDANTASAAVIAYDTRHYSREFAIRTAEVFAGKGISVYIFDSFRSTPELSFAVRELRADIGVVISASHNPPTDNGFKVYWADGGQILPHHGEKIIEVVAKIEKVKRLPINEAEKQCLVHWIGKDMDQKYWAAVSREALPSEDNVHIVYTPLHGTGTTSVLPVLRRLGYQVDVVKKQEEANGDFPEVRNHIPNPEDPAALEQAIERARELEADIVLATDPDADRLGVAVPSSREKKEWVPLTGNQIASLLTYFVLEQLQQNDTIPQDGVVIKTAVTTDLMIDICRSFGVSIISDLLVGFKYIAEIIEENPERFIVGAEESHGFLKGSYTRDKDGAIAALLMVQLTGYLKKQGKTPCQLLDELYRKHGYYKDVVEFILLEGAEGRHQIDQIMEELRNHPPKEIGGLEVVEVRDDQVLRVPEGNFLVFTLSQDGRTRVAVRPSGTEPKIKYYVSVHSEIKETATEEEIVRNKEAADDRANSIIQDVKRMAEAVIAGELSIRYKDLHEIMQAFANPFDTQNVAEVVVGTARRMLRAEASALFVFAKDEQGERLSLLAQEGYTGIHKDNMFYNLEDEADVRHITPWIYQNAKTDEKRWVKIDFEGDFLYHPAYQGRFEGGKYSYALSRGEQSLIGIPLMMGDEPWAVLKVVNAVEPKPHFNDGDRLTLEGLGQLYMTALENSHRMAQQTELTRRLIDFVGKREELYSEIVEECRKLMYAEASSLFLFDEAREYLHLKAAAGYWKEQERDYFYHIDEKKLTPWIAANPDRIIKLDSQEELYKHPAYGERYTGGKFDEDIWGSAGSQCYSLLGLALKGTGGKVIGVLKVENKLPEETAFNDNDVQLLEFMSNIIVLAIGRIP